jgi:hypothetical protein
MTEPNQPAVPLLAAASVEDVSTAAEEVRAADFPDLPAALLSAVLAAERDNLDNRTTAARAVDQAVESYLLRETTDHEEGDA